MIWSTSFNWKFNVFNPGWSSLWEFIVKICPKNMFGFDYIFLKGLSRDNLLVIRVWCPKVKAQGHSMVESMPRVGMRLFGWMKPRWMYTVMIGRENYGQGSGYDLKHTMLSVKHERCSVWLREELGNWCLMMMGLMMQISRWILRCIGQWRWSVTSVGTQHFVISICSRLQAVSGKGFSLK